MIYRLVLSVKKFNFSYSNKILLNYKLMTHCEINKYIVRISKDYSYK